MREKASVNEKILPNLVVEPEESTEGTINAASADNADDERDRTELSVELPRKRAGRCIQ